VLGASQVQLEPFCPGCQETHNLSLSGLSGRHRVLSAKTHCTADFTAEAANRRPRTDHPAVFQMIPPTVISDCQTLRQIITSCWLQMKLHAPVSDWIWILISIVAWKQIWESHII